MTMSMQTTWKKCGGWTMGDILNFCLECGIDSIEEHNTLCEDCASQYTMSDPSDKVAP